MRAAMKGWPRCGEATPASPIEFIHNTYHAGTKYISNASWGLYPTSPPAMPLSLNRTITQHATQDSPAWGTKYLRPQLQVCCRHRRSGLHRRHRLSGCRRRCPSRLIITIIILGGRAKDEGGERTDRRDGNAIIYLILTDFLSHKKHTSKK